MAGSCGRHPVAAVVAITLLVGSTLIPPIAGASSDGLSGPNNDHVLTSHVGDQLRGAADEEATIPLDADPFGVAVDSQSHTALVTHFFAGEEGITLVDTENQTVVDRISTRTQAWGVAVHEDRQEAVVAGSDKIWILDSATGQTRAELKAGTFLMDPGIDPIRDRAFVPDRFADEVQVVDLEEREIVASVNVGQGTAQADVDPLTGDAFLTGRDGDVIKIDGPTLTVAGSVSVSEQPAGVTVVPEHREVYVGLTPSSSYDDHVVVFDTEDLAYLESVNAGGAALTSDTTRQAVYATGDPQTTVVDAPSRETADLAHSAQGEGIGFDPETGVGFVAVASAEELAVFSQERTVG